jgi:hypothetical protein
MKQQRKTKGTHRSVQQQSAKPPFTISSRVLIGIVVAAVVIVAIIFLVREKTIAGEWGFSLDDSWIHLTIARNLATGHGFAFNPGESVAGSTGPLYTILLSLFYLLFGEMIISAKVFGILCQISVAVLTYLSVLNIDPQGKVKAFFAGLLTGISPSLLWASLSGMETSLYLLLFSLGIYFYTKGNDIWATVCWSVGVWVRPDGLFLVAFSLVLLRGNLLKRLAVVAPIVLAFIAFNYLVGGRPFPQSVTAKGGFGFSLENRTFVVLRELLCLFGIQYTELDDVEHPLLFLPLLIVGMILLWRKYPVLAFYALGFPIALSFFRDGSGNHKRYIMYVIPAVIILAMEGGEFLSKKYLKRAAATGVILLGLILVVWQTTFLFKKAEVFAWNVQNINVMQRFYGNWIKNNTQPGDKVAVNDIGAIGYFSERYIVDLMGLITPNKPFYDLVNEYNPAMIVVFPNWFGKYMVRDSTDMYFIYNPNSSTYWQLATVVNLKHHSWICAASKMGAFVRNDRLAEMTPSFRQFDF